MASPHPIHDYIAGALGGAAGLVVGHPFDTVKVQQQVRQTSSPYKGIFDALRNVNRQGMVRGYFRGLAFPLASYGITNSLFFGAYGNTIRWLCGMDHKPTYSDIFIAGCVGGVAQLTVACPADVVKVVMQAQIPKAGEGIAVKEGQYYSKARDCVRGVLLKEGVGGLYRGLNLMAIRDVPAFGLYMVVYEYLFTVISKSSLTDNKGILASLIAGGFAGFASWVVVHPFDVVKSIYQADQGYTRKTMWQHTVQLQRTVGYKGFFAGIIMNSVRAFPVNAMTFLVYSQSLKFMSCLPEKHVH